MLGSNQKEEKEFNGNSNQKKTFGYEKEGAIAW